MTFQRTPAGVSPTELVAAHAQSNNESNAFIIDMERSAALAVQVSGAGVKNFTNFAVDGVSCESKHVWTSLCNFLSLEVNHVGSTDTNHNIKSWRYQIIAGSGTQGCIIGKLMIDSYTLLASKHASILQWYLPWSSILQSSRNVLAPSYSSVIAQAITRVPSSESASPCISAPYVDLVTRLCFLHS